MRIKLSLELKDKSSNVLPANYQYPLASWIYKVLHYGDAGFSAWLHSHGYAFDKKKFKLFTFSNITTGKYLLAGDRFILQYPGCELTISMLPLKSINTFVTGLFKNQQFGLGDKTSQADFIVKQVQTMPAPQFGHLMHYKTLTPILLKKYVEGKKHAQYIFPGDKDYTRLLKQNLWNKYQALNASGLINDMDINEAPGALTETDIHFTEISKGKNKLITIKENTSSETKLRCCHAVFTLQAPVAIQKLAYYAGVGDEGSMGLGMVELDGEN